ncbi:hypothetical protein SY83_04460 [Paenibacillus swuensis]|uniref:O-antigen ligase-related domain-containing protein n=2 Tax=Paenibacillus swuensis TaxID=1178515 RepID=A0A172TFG0_9BACL|nr:hypothetical protein SY83_04460 [Paenibacillus swuensis]
MAMGVTIWRDKKIELTWLHLGLALLVTLYWSACLYAASPSLAVKEAAKITSVFPVAFLASRLTSTLQWRLMRQVAWVGTFLVVWGWFFHLFRNGRLESTFGYANTLAILLLVGIAVAWRALSSGGDRIMWLPILVLTAGLIQTQSRMVLLLFGGWLIYTIMVSVFWGENRKRTAIFLGLASVAAVAVVLWAGIGGRLMRWDWNTPELKLRRVYWEDGFEMASRFWYRGLGGGGWEALHPPGYFVKYVHQYYLQLVLDVGVAGLLLFLGIVGVTVWSALRGKSPVTHLYLPLIIIFLVHAGFDIDFSFSLCFGVFILCLACFNGNSPSYIWRLKIGTKN